MSANVDTTRRKRTFVVAANRIVYWVDCHWLLIISLILGLYVGLPWLAPIFMKLGWANMGENLYLIYSTQCHQLPERSYFLFGPKASYSLAEIQAAWQVTNNPLILRQFVGDPQMGWKVAWSDRMISMYTSIFLFGIFYWPLRKRLKPLPLWGLIFLTLPMVVDGGTHLISDLAGIGQGFRDDNTWLAMLTNSVFPRAFYAGDELGSFNSWARLITGTLFGLGIVWLAYPHIENAFANMAQRIEEKFRRANLPLQ